MSLSLKDVDFGDQNIIFISDQANALEWTISATQEMIKLLSENLDLFDKGVLKTKRQIYERISPELAKKGFFYSAGQCENKWKSLKRSYSTRFDKNPGRRLHPKSRLFEKEIEEILKRERPDFKKQMNDYLTINLNQPPGFTQKEEFQSDDEDDDPVQRVLKESNSLTDTNLIDNNNDVDDNIEHMFTSNIGNLEHSYSFLKESSRPSRSTAVFNDRLIREIKDLKDVVKGNCDTNTQILKSNQHTKEQIATFLDILEKKEDEKLEIKRRKLEKQGEILQQMKIQNSLIAKLIQKLG